MKNNIFYLLLALSMVQMGCIDELNIDTTEERNILVVEGFISTNPGPHSILLSKSAKYGNIFEGFIEKETKATVRIRDDRGEQIFLEETTKGLYQTPSEYQAEVGRSYTLIIELANGENYISKPEPCIEVEPIEELVAVFEKIPGIDEFTFQSGMEIYARWNTTEDLKYYWWQSNGVHKIFTRPDLFTFVNDGGIRVAAPKDCCETCFVDDEEGDQNIRIFRKDLGVEGELTQLAAFIEDDGKRFQERYMFVLQHSSISKEAFQFYSVLDNQLSIDGDIFDPPPASIRGNMVNLDNPDEDVIGFFRVSDVTSDSIFIDRGMLPELQATVTINDDCRELSGATINVPDFWR